MKRICAQMLMIVVATATWAASTPAQQAGSSGPSPSGNASKSLYPPVDANLQASFRISAAGATQVVLELNGRHEMTRDANGLWRITTDPLTPGFHYYSFIVDGVPVADPACESYFAMGRMVSGIEVPAKGEDFYVAKNVPHGDIHGPVYVTKSPHESRRVLIYTPPDYDQGQSRRYPVLYLQHGYGEDQQAWLRQGKANFILDNLLAAGKAKPMIVVMANGGIATRLDYGRGRGPAGAPATDADRVAFALAFEPVMIKELIPMIDANFRTIADREHRAMAGTSMGALQTLQITVKHLDTFAYIGGFSPALSADISRIADAPGTFNEKVKVLFLGTAEIDGNPNIKNLHEILEKAGVKHVYYESPGMADEWLTWRRELYQFAPLLF